MQNQVMQHLAQQVMQKCNPQMRQIIHSAQTPQQAIQMLCNQYPDIARQIDTAIGQGQNPQQMVMNFLQNPGNRNF
jgi:hypothetical protein